MSKCVVGRAVLFGCLLAGSVFAGNPAVSNVRASQRGGGSKIVDIYYDVADSDGDRLTVSVAVTTNGGAVPATTLTGAVGAGVTPGPNKQVVWDAGADWADNFSSSVRVSITANDGRTNVPIGMVLIPSGTNSGTDPDWGAYSLTVTNFFYMDRTEVTKAQWDTVYNWAIINGYSFTNGVGKATNHPVCGVSWYDCVKWCNARSQMEGRTPCYNLSDWSCNFSANGYRLPTVYERKYAARGGFSGSRFPWGNTITHSQANYCSVWSNGVPRYSYDVNPTIGYHPLYATGSKPYTSPVGSFAPNGYGLYDMAGNLSEWCWDSSGSFRSVWGGNWDDDARYPRIGGARWGDPYTANYANGLRAVCH